MCVCPDEEMIGVYDIDIEDDAEVSDDVDVSEDEEDEDESNLSGLLDDEVRSIENVMLLRHIRISETSCWLDIFVMV
jgi:hypothetical protein